VLSFQRNEKMWTMKSYMKEESMIFLLGVGKFKF